ncbi:MAG: ABC-type transport auxiliary lipoprotein family protein [Planctomycetota bacterium]
MTRRRSRLHAPAAPLLGALLCLLAPACIDLEPKEGPQIRWIRLGDLEPARRSELAAPEQPRLQLERVEASDGLTDQLKTRRTEFEVTYEELVRWTEPPQDVVQRALEAELFRSRGFERATTPPRRRLRVTVLAFEETLVPRHEGIVRLSVRLVDPSRDTILLDRVLEGREPIDGDDAALVAEALTVALRSVVTELSDLVATR